MNRIAKFLSLAAFTSILGSAGLASAVGEQVSISYMGCTSTGECFIGVSPQISMSSSSCTNRAQVRFMINSTSGESFYRTALAAQYAGKKLLIDAANVPCVGQFAGVGLMQTVP